ncbi:hypothetical protein GCM10020256_47740 [Streptomyces thermocoprophilus]
MDSRSDASASYPFPPTPRRAQQPYGNPRAARRPTGTPLAGQSLRTGTLREGPGRPTGTPPVRPRPRTGGAPVAAPPVWDDTPYATTPGNAPATSVDTVDTVGTPADTPAGTGDAPAAGDKPQRKPGRDRYFDLLRAVALFRVVFYHLTGWAWLPIVFPSMGVMFALAGNLMARSLKRPAVQVIRGRMRRLLPPLWLLGAIGVTGMLLQGWGARRRRPPRLVVAAPHLLDRPAQRPAVRRGPVRHPRRHRRRLGGGTGRTPVVHPRLPLVRAAVAADPQGPAPAAMADDLRAHRPLGGLPVRLPRTPR